MPATTRKKQGSKQKKRKGSKAYQETSNPENNNPVNDKDEIQPNSPNAATTSNSQAKSNDNTEAVIVFQCGACRAIIGDTSCDFNMDLDNKTLSLRGACGVTTQKEVLLSKSGMDVGCTYRKINCTECNQHLGKMYTSTTAPMDSRRSTFTFELKALASYQLGTCRTVDGKSVATLNVNGTQGGANNDVSRDPKKNNGFASAEAFDSLDNHVNSVTEATNRLATGFEQNREAISEMRLLLDNLSRTMQGYQGGLENAQNMILVWEDRFKRLESCEKQVGELGLLYENLEQVQQDVTRLDKLISQDSNGTVNNEEESDEEKEELPVKRKRKSDSFQFSRTRSKQRKR